MDWENEPYVKVYTRDTDDDLVLSWQATALWHAMLRKFERSGLLETRRGLRGLAAIVRIPLEVVTAALPELLADGRVREVPDGYLAPNFIAAQEARKSDKLRQRESRERRRQRSLAGEPAHDRVTIRDQTSRVAVTNRDDPSREPGVGEQNVTLCSADPDPDPLPGSAPARARDPGAGGPAPRPGEDPEVLARRALKDRKLKALEEVRARVAGKLGVAYRPLPAFSDRELSDRIREAATEAGHELARIEADIDHVLALREEEAIAKRTLEYLTGLMFGETTWKKALGMTLEDAARPRLPPRAAEPPTIQVVEGPDEDEIPSWEGPKRKTARP